MAEALNESQAEFLIGQYKGRKGNEPRSSWKDEFKLWADIVMNLGAPYCGTLQECADSMYTYFKVSRNKSNLYLQPRYC